ncbi:MAG: DNA-protecting protein DprA [Nocardioidaceae bacterium]|nr:DNA-protecting protein DprA [Nocardioidaceae bacterium]
MGSVSDLRRGVSPDERRARVVLSRVVEPGDVDASRLVREHSAAALLTRLVAGTDLDKPKVRDWSERLSRADHDHLMGVADSVSARYLCPGDDEWPVALDDLQRLEEESGDRRGGAPFGLWVRGGGHLRRLAHRSVAIVGARASTAYGEHVAGALAFGCAEKGFTVVSGGAFGIDAAGHRGALAQGGPTMAVLASGVDRLYPPGNTPLLKRIAETGLVVSEVAPGCVPSKSRFLVRNRLIAALTQGTVVVEAALRSGSLNTARWALDALRPVMGVPGPVTATSSAGVHQLLRHPATLLVTDAEEVIEHISRAGENLAAVKQGPTTARDRLHPRSRQLLDAIPAVLAATSESLAKAAGLSHCDVVDRLRELEHLGAVVREDENRWRIARS